MDLNEAGSSQTNDKSEEENDEVVEMYDVVKAQDEMIENVAAVLGAGDDTNCTYSMGYVNRQALYACLTCIPESTLDCNKSAGVCLACSYHCHDGHNLIELYTKRNFRCDCGNTKFTNFTCNLHKEKDELNYLNKYNQNFSGVYCTCSKPYPDPEETVDDEMVQCIICEDWYHSRHLGVPPPGNYAEMICEACVKKHEFLLYYDGLMLTTVTNASSDSNVEVDSTPVENGKADENTPSKSADCPSECVKPKNKSNISAKFMEDITWREKLCKCSECLKLYEDEDVLFLIDVEDTIQVYVEKGKEKAKEIQTKEIQSEQQFLNSLDRVTLLEVLAGYNEFKEELSEFLKKFAASKKVIQVKDVEDFFAEFKSRKRQKLELPYHCR